MLTYINFKEDGKFEYNDGFSCGLFYRIPTRETILHHCSDDWRDERDVWIGNRKDSKARYVQDQWIKFLEEFESGDVKHGVRLGWFDESEGKVVAEIEKFRAALRKIGYDVDDRIVEEIFKLEGEK